MPTVRRTEARSRKNRYPDGVADAFQVRLNKVEPSLAVWSRNLLSKDYFDLLTAAPGNTGLYVGQPGDPRTVGVTLRLAFRGK